jgi:hypothetical protein
MAFQLPSLFHSSNRLPAKIIDGFLDEGWANLLTSFPEAQQEGIVAKNINFAGDALGNFPDQAQRLRAEKHRSFELGHPQAVLDIGVGFFFFKRVDVAPYADSFGELAQFGSSQFGLQLRLAG